MLMHVPPGPDLAIMESYSLQMASSAIKNVSLICWRQGVLLATDYGGPKNYGELACQ
jgi:hypothetical protein